MTATATSTRDASTPAVARVRQRAAVGMDEVPSLRSTVVCLGLTVVATVGLAVALGARWAHEQGKILSGFDSTNTSLGGVYIAQIILGTLGALTISSEYTTGMVRATFAAVPQRRAVLAAKALVLAGVTLVLGEVVCFVSFGIFQVLVRNKHIGASLADPGVLRAVSGAGLYLTAVVLLGFGLGATIRHTAGALSAFFGLLFAPTALVDLLPTSWRNDLINYMPANSGSQIFTDHAGQRRAVAVGRARRVLPLRPGRAHRRFRAGDGPRRLNRGPYRSARRPGRPAPACSSPGTPRGRPRLPSISATTL